MCMGRWRVVRRMVAAAGFQRLEHLHREAIGSPVCCLLSALCSLCALLFAICCLLSAVCCLLSTVCFLLSAVSEMRAPTPKSHRIRNLIFVHVIFTCAGSAVCYLLSNVFSLLSDLSTYTAKGSGHCSLYHRIAMLGFTYLYRPAL
jgi:hypothetical protein